MGVIFVSGNLALDYVGTLNERFGKRVEQLNTPADLGEWIVAAQVLDTPPAVTTAELERGLALRETIFTVIAREIDGTTLRMTGAEQSAINEAAAQPPPVPVLSATGEVTYRGDLTAGLAAVARDAIALFDRSDGSLLKWCADDDCTHPFLDRSRGHRRRWCGMAGCGDRAKAAAYRARKRDA